MLPTLGRDSIPDRYEYNVTTVAPPMSAGCSCSREGSFDPPSPVEELVEKRTEWTKSWLMADGSQAVQVVAAPLHVQDGAGGWIDIDASLTAQPDGYFVADTLPVEVSLPETAAGAVIVSDGESASNF